MIATDWHPEQVVKLMFGKARVRFHEHRGKKEMTFAIQGFTVYPERMNNFGWNHPKLGMELKPCPTILLIFYWDKTGTENLDFILQASLRAVDRTGNDALAIFENGERLVFTHIDGNLQINKDYHIWTQERLETILMPYELVSFPNL